MFTTNFINLTKLFALAEGASSGYSCVDCNGISFNASLSHITYGFLSYMDYGRCRTQPSDYVSGATSSYAGVYFGTGTTPPTRADFNLEGLLTSGLSVSSGNRLYVADGSNYAYRCTYTLTNTTESDITIREIGLFAPVFAASAKCYTTLMERTVLDEPITITPGETRLVTSKITFHHTQ